MHVARALGERGVPTKNLPDALDWHFAGTWAHLLRAREPGVRVSPGLARLPLRLVAAQSDCTPRQRTDGRLGAGARCERGRRGRLLTRIDYLGIVPARGGSKGIPRKNLAELGGKPLVQHSIEAGLASARLDALLLSSDDPEIIDLGTRLGCAVVVRPAELATDEASTLDAVLHAIGHVERELELQPESVVLLQPTSPFRTSADIDHSLEAFERSGAQTLASVVPVLQHPCDCVRVVDNRLERAFPLPHPNARRQELPEFHYIDGAIYVANAEFLRSSGVFVDEQSATFVLPEGHGLEIDDAYQLDLARGLLRLRSPDA